MHVFLILAHKAPEQVARLVDRLAGGDGRFLVHIDRNARPAVHRGTEELLGAREDLRFLKPMPTPWAGTGHLLATLAGMKVAARTWPQMEHLSLLTGQDYPLKSPAQIAQLLHERPATGFLEHFPLPRLPGQTHRGATDQSGWVEGGWDRIFPRRRLRLARRELVIPFQRRLPPDLPLYGGSGYWTLSAEAVDYVRRTVRRRPGVLRFFRHVHIPHEMFFQTVLASSPLADGLVNDDLYYIDWSEGGAHPKLLTAADLPALRASPKCFARKFDHAVDAGVLDRIDRELLGRSPC